MYLFKFYKKLDISLLVAQESRLLLTTAIFHLAVQDNIRCGKSKLRELRTFLVEVSIISDLAN